MRAFSWQILKGIFWHGSVISVFLIVGVWNVLIGSEIVERFSQGPGFWRETLSDLRRFFKKTFPIQDVEAGLIKMSHLGNSAWRFNRFSTACIAVLPSAMPFW
jgi:hypothetical protein